MTTDLLFQNNVLWTRLNLAWWQAQGDADRRVRLVALLERVNKRQVRRTEARA